MFRQMLKLRQARKAYDEGRFREAFDLAADPEIADHLKAVRLRQACLDALGESAAGHARRGELTLALDDVDFLRARGGAEVAAPRKSEIEEQIAERDGLAARVRARFYRARLDAERGDLVAARTILDGLEPDLLEPEMKTFRADLDQRITSARQGLEEALRLVAREPGRAEELLAAAARTHPRAEGLKEAWGRLAARRLEAVVRGKIGDPALAAFLADWAIFKRARLDGGDGADGRHDDELRRHVLDRIRSRLDADEEPDEALKLLGRLREALGPGVATGELAAGVEALGFAAEKIAEGDYPPAREALARAELALGRTRCGKALLAELERARKNWEPYLERAERALAGGDAAAARHELLALVELVPEHREARRRLEALAGSERDRLALLLALHGDLDKGDLAKARGRVAAAGIDLARDEEVADLLRAVELASVGRERPRPEFRGRGGEESAPASALDRGLFRLSIEEHGELLVAEDDLLGIGAAGSPEATLRFLAPLGAIQARIERKIDFHSGVSYQLRPEPGREVEVGGERLREGRKLRDGDEIRLGRELRLRFEMPLDRSRAALLVVLSDHDCEGCSRIALMPPRGRSGAILIGPFARAHVSTPGLEGEIEIHRESEEAGGELVARGPLGVALDDDEARARVVLRDQATVTARDLVIHVGVLPPRV